MATAVIPFESVPAGDAMLHTPAGLARVLPIPWRDPRTVERDQPRRYIAMLERACAEQPRNADSRTCLGMAHAIHYDVTGSVDALERSEEETRKAVDLDADAAELALAGEQFDGIRRLKRKDQESSI